MIALQTKMLGTAIEERAKGQHGRQATNSHDSLPLPMSSAFGSLTLEYLEGRHTDSKEAEGNQKEVAALNLSRFSHSKVR